MQRDGGSLTATEKQDLDQHLGTCSVCRASEQNLQQLEHLFERQPTRTCGRTSTGNIMLAIQKQKYITAQLDDLREKQQSRWARIRRASVLCAVGSVLLVASLPLFLLAIILVRGEMAVSTLTSLQGILDLFIVSGNLVQAGIMRLSQDNWLLATVALAVVLMMGIWLRLMRYPQEV
jgi:hypothetical protein